MSLCRRVLEPLEAKARPSVRPQPCPDPRAIPINLYWVAKQDYAAYQEATGFDFTPMGSGKSGSEAIVIREPYVPYAYRIDAPGKRWSHRHYWERLHHVRGSKSFRVDAHNLPVKEGGHIEKVATWEMGVEVHNHELGHTVLDLRHDAPDYPVMDGHTTRDPERVILGRRTTQHQRGTMFNEVLDRHPCITTQQWTPENHPF